MKSVLVLAGTREARKLAQALTRIEGLEVTASLAGATEDPAALPCPTRTGGFGGADGLSKYLSDHRIAALINATHPYAIRMQANAVEAAAHAATPRLRLLRAPWPSRPGWHHVADLEAAAAVLPTGARALLTTGRTHIAAFAARTDCHFVLRSIEHVPGLPRHIEPLRGRPPFTAETERALFALLGITHLVTRNAGGAGTAKLDVADEGGLTTIMIGRPPPPPGAIADSVEDAVAWARRRVAIR